jgi:hypothetical protein
MQSQEKKYGKVNKSPIIDDCVIFYQNYVKITPKVM